jgi:hypothetical protein
MVHRDVIVGHMPVGHGTHAAVAEMHAYQKGSDFDAKAVERPERSPAVNAGIDLSSFSATATRHRRWPTADGTQYDVYEQDLRSSSSIGTTGST